MFRCVTTLRGLVIDIDTFEEPIEQWKVLLENYFCCFLTFKEETKRLLEKNVVVQQLFLSPSILMCLHLDQRFMKGY